MSDIEKITDEILEKLPKSCMADIRYIKSGDHWVDLLHKNANKGAMIGKLQEKYGISKEQTVVFGDYDNDLEMFDYSINGYAMADARDVVKAKANFICESNADNAVLNKIKRNCRDLKFVGI